jgi:hypothetical protein
MSEWTGSTGAGCSKWKSARIGNRAEKLAQNSAKDQLNRGVLTKLSIGKNGEYMSDRSLERARLQPAPHIDLVDLRHGWEAVPFQNSNAESFSAGC